MNQSLTGWVLVLIYPTCYISDIKFFLYLNIYSVINFFVHLLNCSRSEASFSSCNFCSLLLVDNASVSFRSSIDHYFKLTFSENVFSQTTSEIFNVEKNNRFSLNIFYVGKTVHKINVSVKVRIFPLNMCDIIIFAAQWWEKYLSKRSLLKHTCSWRDNLLYYEYWTEEQKYFHVKCVTVLNQFDLIILFAEVFVRIFCHHFYLVSFDFLFLLEQTAKVISKR